jgi:hypothetical protein
MGDMGKLFFVKLKKRNLIDNWQRREMAQREVAMANIGTKMVMLKNSNQFYMPWR